jgi:23S rRNA (cytidine1920-2'-O)/16S rRNA (cytidine1409-2'-O)-methyltransferase
VLVGGAVASKASRQVSPADAIVLQGAPPRFVGRGGEKLDAALEELAVDVAGLRCVDAGASTGGFTDCLLQRGAREVVAIDVGYGQLHERLVADPRVLVHDRTNIRALTAADIGGPADLLVGDLSFISLRVVADALLELVVPDASLVLLVKPQFEAGRAEASKGRGIIADDAVWRRVLHEVIAAFAERGATMMGVMASPITGTDGNVEFLVHLRRGRDTTAAALGAARVEACVDALVARRAAGAT